MEQEISLPAAAMRLGRSWRSTWKLVVRGELGPARMLAGRWVLQAEHVAAYAARSTQSAAPPAA